MGEQVDSSSIRPAGDEPVLNPKWSQEEAISYECARDCVTDLMGICSREIADEESRPVPDAIRLAAHEHKLAELAHLRSALTVADQGQLAKIRSEFGALVRAYREHTPDTVLTALEMADRAKAGRRLAHEQALASSRISGHVPSREYLADCEAVVDGTMTREQARARSLERARAACQSSASSAEGTGLTAADDSSREGVSLPCYEVAATKGDADLERFFESHWDGPRDSEFFATMRAGGRGVGLDENDELEYGFAEIPHGFGHPKAGASLEKTPLSPEQRAAYAAAVELLIPVYAAAGVEPSPKDSSIIVAICAGRVSAERAREELSTFLLAQKTSRGFLDSRPWGAGLPSRVWEPSRRHT